MKISQYTEVTTPPANSFLILESNSATNSKISTTNFSSNLSGVVFTTGNQTISGDKTFNGNTVINSPNTTALIVNGVFKIGGQMNGAVPTGGLLSINGSGLNDNIMFLEFFSHDSSASASEVHISGRFSSNVPILKLCADNLIYRNQSGTEQNWSNAWTSYTPILTGSAVSGAGQTYLLQQGAYKVYGKTVHFRVNLRMSSFGTASGAINISLPAIGTPTTPTDFPLNGFICDIADNPATQNKGVPIINGNDNIGVLIGVDTVALTIAGVSTNTVFRISGTYEII